MSTFFLNSLQLILSLTLEMKSTSGNELASLLGLAATFSRRCIIGRLITYYTALDGQNWNYSFSHYDLISIEIQVSFLQNKCLINFACRFWFKWQIETISVCWKITCSFRLSCKWVASVQRPNKYTVRPAIVASWPLCIVK